MINAKALSGLGRLSRFAGMVLIALAIFVLSLPDVDARRSGGGGVWQSGGKSGGARSGIRSGGTSHHKKSSGTSRKKKSSATKSKGTARAGAKRGGRAHRPSHGRYSSHRNSRSSYHRWHRRRGLVLFGLGVYLATRPRYTTTIVVTGSSYYYWGGAYYVTSGSGYVVVAAPPGAVVHAVPTYTTLVYVGSTPYYYYGGTYYVATTAPAPEPEEPPEGEVLSEDEEGPPMTEDDHNYEVVGPPVGVTVPYLPDEAEQITINGTLYYAYDLTYYRAFISDGDTIYQVVEAPE